MSDLFGFGQVGFGRFAFGQADSEYDPRYSDSDPYDGETGVEAYQTIIRFSLYCFSSRVRWDVLSRLFIEISEDNGGSFSPAFEDGAFVAPYDGANSRIDAQQADPQRFTMIIERTGPWPKEDICVVRVTAYDQYGEIATKETPVEWS